MNDLQLLSVPLPSLSFLKNPSDGVSVPSKYPINVGVFTHHRCDSPHSHDYMHIWYTRRGSYSHVLGGKKYILPEGSVVLVPPYSTHYIDMSESVGQELVCIDLCPSDLISPDDSDKVPALFSCRTHGTYFMGNPISSVAMFDGEKLDLCNSLFDEMVKIFPDRDNVNSQQALINAIFSLFELMPAPDCEDKLSAKRLRTLSEQFVSIYAVTTQITQLSSNGNEFSMSFHEACNISAMSKSTFCAAFREITGYTFGTYLTLSRVRKVSEALTFSEFSLSEISDYLGFSNKSHMINTFSSKTLYKPTDFRNFSRSWYSKYAPEDLMHDPEAKKEDK